MLACKRAMQTVVLDLRDSIERDVRRLVLDDAFWSDAQSVYECLLPIATSIAKLESDHTVLSDVPEFFRVLESAAESLLSNCQVTEVCAIGVRVTNGTLTANLIYTFRLRCHTLASAFECEDAFAARRRIAPQTFSIHDTAVRR